MKCSTEDEMHPRHHFSPARSDVRAGEADASFWNDMAQTTLATHLTWQPKETLAKNVIMFLGDGLSIPTLAAARIKNGGEQSTLIWEDQLQEEKTMQHFLCHIVTYCVDTMVADSACSATAYLCGVKANTATIGVTASVQNKDCNAMRNTSNHVYSIIRKAQLAGLATGIVTTTRITHASPAGAYAHTADRDWENDDDVSNDGRDPAVCDDIAEMLIRGETGQNLNVILGGGRYNFRPSNVVDEEGSNGRRNDGGRIDHAHHETRAQYALDETIQFDHAIRAALAAVNIDDTLIVMTADHAHTMSLNGYPDRGGDLLDLKPYSTLSYGNGPGYKNPNPDGSRYDISNDDFTDPRYQYPAVAPLGSETHGGDDVGVFAWGPWAHLYTGTYEQNYIAHVMAYASCLGEGLTSCTAIRNE
ncbi:hypothetical protein B566_EDAN011447 [Ephemera danica]|nr:hypothetical protein B566_EDAN011447 [Ephemera danica]